jgi:hypothetical protein
MDLDRIFIVEIIFVVQNDGLDVTDGLTFLVGKDKLFGLIFAECVNSVDD